MSDEYDAIEAWTEVDNVDDLKKRIVELETKLNSQISQADSLTDELMKLRYISERAIKVFNNMAFVVLYHHSSIRVEFTYHGQFSTNLKIVYVADDPMFINKVLGLYIIGYWFEHDTNLECQAMIEQRRIATLDQLCILKGENG